jgi:hypothetical protein
VWWVGVSQECVETVTRLVLLMTLLGEASDDLHRGSSGSQSLQHVLDPRNVCRARLTVVAVTKAGPSARAITAQASLGPTQATTETWLKATCSLKLSWLSLTNHLRILTLLVLLVSACSLCPAKPQGQLRPRTSPTGPGP